jgi:Tfp pilus assembly protein PilF
MLMQSGNLELAKSELDLACKLDPKSINAQYALYQLYSKLGDREAAEKTLQIFKEL